MKSKHQSLYDLSIHKQSLGGGLLSLDGVSLGPSDTQIDLRSAFYKFNQDRFYELFLKFIISNEQSFNVVECPDFKTLVTYLNRSASLKSADTISRDIRAKFKTVRTEVI